VARADAHQPASLVNLEPSREACDVAEAQAPTSRVKRVIEIAFAVCSTMSRPRVETGHILLALAIEGESIAGHVLKDMGAGQAQIEKELDQLTEPEP
jgi:ATP-dependent Clp protease ATP-binding subunit ClpA